MFRLPVLLVLVLVLFLTSYAPVEAACGSSSSVSTRSRPLGTKLFSGRLIHRR